MTDLDAFHALRPRLLRVAYRLLGSLADAEDVVQEAFLRWLRGDRTKIREPEAFLRQVVTRLCLDQLKSARRRRENYVGSWLPEPLVEDSPGPEDVTLPLMLALERLSPLERVAFVLHDIFGVAFTEVAHAIGRDPAACRQLARRARSHVRAARPRFRVADDQGRELADAFYLASRSGDLTRLRALLSVEVAVHTDGGGRVAAPRRPVRGQDAVLRLFAGLTPIFQRHPSLLLRRGIVDGLPGFVTIEEGDLVQTTALQVSDAQVDAIYVTRNPEKLRHLRGLAAH